MLDQPLSERLRAARESQAAPDEGQAPASSEELPHRVPLGQLLIDKGVLSDSDLMLALAQQRQDGRPLGQILLEMGFISQSDLARTLTEQHGFDFNASLRQRLASVDGAEPADEPVLAAAEPEPEPESAQGERYLVRESGVGDPLHVADSFLDAADAAFELIEERGPLHLEIVRATDGRFEQLWSYHRDDASDPAGPPSDAG